jgi:fatty acid synthase subunit alpha
MRDHILCRRLPTELLDPTVNTCRLLRCYCNNQLVIEVISSFLYRGRFVDYENTFDTTEEPNYLAHLESDADVWVLQSKEWFEWDETSPSLLAGTSLIFRIQTQVSFKDKTAVSVSGDIFIRNQLKVLVKVGSVDFQQDDSQGNPVLAYLQRHGTPQGLTTPLANGYSLTTSLANGYSLNIPDVSTTFNALLTNEPYSKISGASIPSTLTLTSPILHLSLLLSPTECGIVLQPAAMLKVLLGDELTVKFRHIGMWDGNIVVDIETSNARGEKVIQGSAEVSQSSTAYVFTGQEPGMGMDSYNSSSASRAVWEGAESAADTHLLAVYGFSIVEIFKDKPKEKTILFGGIKGQARHSTTLHGHVLRHNGQGRPCQDSTSLCWYRC